MLLFYFDVVELDRRWMLAMRKIFKREKKEIGEDDAVFQWPIIFHQTIPRKMKQDAHAVLEKHGLKAAEVEHWRFHLSELCHLKRNDRLKQYLRFVDPDFIINAEETNRMICILNRYLWLLTDQRRTVKQVLLDMASPPCKYCCAPITLRANRQEQQTCGRVECMRKWDADVKRKKRRSARAAGKRRV